MKILKLLLPVIFLSLTITSCFGPFDPENPGRGLVTKNPNGPTPLTETLVAYWKCDDSGKTILKNSAKDSTRNQGDPYSVDFGKGFDYTGYSLIFNANKSSKVTVRDDSTLDFGTRDFTISLWCKPFNTNNDTIVILSKDHKDSLTSANTYTIECAGKKLIVKLGQKRYFSSEARDTLIDTVWNHIVVTRLDGKLTLYLNNNAFSPDAFIHDLTNNNRLVLGMDARDFWKYSGALDEIKILREAWDALDVSGEYNKITK